MPKAVIILPFANGSAQLPGLTVEQQRQCSWVCASYMPPPPGTAPYVLVFLGAPQAVIDILTARADCLHICAITEAGYDTAPLAAQERNAVRTKVSNMGFTGTIYGLLNTAIQASQNKSELAFALSNKAFFRDVKKNFMIADDLRGCQIGGDEKAIVGPKEIEK